MIISTCALIGIKVIQTDLYRISRHIFYFNMVDDIIWKECGKARWARDRHIFYFNMVDDIIWKECGKARWARDNNIIGRMLSTC